MKRIGLAGLLACGLAALPAIAEPPPYPEFTFKRVKPPAGDVARRITVQIAPRPGVVPPAATDDAPDAVPGIPSPYDWYWQAVSPALDDSGPGRLNPAVAALGKGPDGAQVPAPRLQAMQGLAQDYGIEILKATVGTRVSPALVLAVMGVESGGRPAAVSVKGATGLMQLMPATAERFGVADSTDPVQNIRGGVAYLDWLMGRFDRDPVLVLAGYNAGENAVAEHGGVPPYAETRAYVPKVLAAWTVARGLCLTPPELITDGCVFAVGRSG
ncbi:lytic transglycosylase domain-containing protein [Actibacterium sp. D379-3]